MPATTATWRRCSSRKASSSRCSKKTSSIWRRPSWPSPKGSRPNRRSLPDNLHQHPLPPPAVEFVVEDVFPGPQVQPTLGNRHHHLAAHDLPLQVRIGIILARPIVLISG